MRRQGRGRQGRIARPGRGTSGCLQHGGEMGSDVLLVDDEPICREPIARLLRLEGMAVTCASDGIEALRTMRASRPGMVLLDLTLPRLSGLDVLRVIRRSEEFREL